LAHDAQEALAILEHDKAFNVIISDIEMPGLNGFEFVKKVRGMGDEFSRIPVIALTSKSLKYEAEEFQSAGFNEFLDKSQSQNILKIVQQFV